MQIEKQLENYLKLAHSSALLVSKEDKANLNVLLEMLGHIDKDIISARYGLFGYMEETVAQIALKYHVPPSAIEEIVRKDLRKIAITPEWQMLLRQLKPVVQKKIGFEK